ncbi:MAG TPA: VOC family protein [Candidatus Binatia bacterium]|jgi:catechol 2,3-dioxygenase-like lactoylglutathione lyase family enzyme|nr:VOC family protein [Candidatus Binatia bacterium]
MSVNGDPTIERIDHGVVPSNDLGRAHRFYGTFMGGEIDHLTNLTIRGLNREVPQIVFYTLANHKGWGVALQDFPISPNPTRPLEGVVYGFEVAADNLGDVVRAAAERKLKFHGPVEYAAPCPIQESLFVLDPDGNTMELSIRRDPVRDKPQGKIVPLRRISHVRVEVTDLEQGKVWYRDTFGLTEKKQVPDDEQITLTVPNTGQLVILRHVDQVAERSTRAVKGPHIDFRVDPAVYPPILEKFNRKEYYWGPDPTKIPWHEQGGHTVYGYDPFGNRIQIGHRFGERSH